MAKAVKNEPNQKCEICKGPLATPEQEAIGWYLGNNAQPIIDGRCCNNCNENVVLPARIRIALKHMQAKRVKE
jgi:hypothetical protein